MWSSFDNRDEHACLVESFQSAHAMHMMCLLPISFLWFDDLYVAALFDMICEACLDVWLGFVMWWMLGWSDLHD